MFDQSMPRGEDEMLTFCDAQWVIKVLFIDGDDGDILERCNLFFPFRRRIFDRQGIASSDLHLKIEDCRFSDIDIQAFFQRLAQIT
jgi:hypothetical protein